MSQPKHTPLSWLSEAFEGCDEHTQIGIADADGNIIAKVVNPRIAHEEEFAGELEGNAAFIVTACNMHYDLVASLKDILSRFVDCIGIGGEIDGDKEAIAKARDAIAKASGGAA
jgi:hypothetical protein